MGSAFCGFVTKAGGKWQIEPRVDNVTRLKPDIDTKYDSLLTSELVELSIIHTSAPSHINTMISTQLHSREIVKHAKYDAYSILLHKTLKSFCLTTYGVFSKEAHEAIYNIANRAKRQNLITSTHSFSRSIYNELLVALHRGNAQVLINGEEAIRGL